MDTQLTKQAGLQKNAEHKTFEQSGFKAPMPAPKIVKNASMQLQGMQKTAMMSSQQQPTFWYSPDLTPDAWLLPKSEVEALRFYKIYYNLDPYIHSIINMHAQYGFSKFFLQYKDPSIAQLFNKLLFYNQTFDWYQFVLDVALSYYKYGEACLAGDTKIRLLNGTTKTIKELYDEKAKDFWVYSLDEKGNIVPGKADEVLLTRKNAKLVQVTLDNGESFKCTPDHKCMLRNGEYVEAQDLKEGDTLMPFYTKENNVYYKTDKSKQKYEMIYNPGLAHFDGDKTGVWKYTHKVVAEYASGKHIPGAVVHHKNFNKNDNTPDNLEQLTRAEHQKLHTRNYTPEQIAIFRQRTKDLYKKPGYRSWMGKKIKAAMTDAVRAKISEAGKLAWANPEYKAQQSAKHKGIKRTAETKARLSVLAKERYLRNPEEVLHRLAKATAAATKANTGRKYSLERRQQISARMKAAWKAGVYKNHKVISVVACANEDVYDIHSVGSFHNFALDCGVFVHNCIWGDWNTARRTWNRFTLLDPAIVEYKEDLFTGHVTVELIPTIEMKKAVRTALLQGRTDISPLLVDAIQNNKKLPLDTEGRPENVFTGEEYVPPKVAIFSRKTDPSSTRGTSIISPLLKDLIYKDQLRLSQLAVAQKTQLPIELWTVGHIGNDDQSSMIPGDDLLEEVRQIITEATQQPPYSIVYGPYLKYEALGVAGKLLDIYNDLGYVENQLLVGLGTNKAVVLGEGPNVQGKNIALNRQIRSYQVVRDLFSNFFKTNILLPIARANNLVDEDGQFIIPDLVWELSLQPEQDKEVFDMFYKMWKDGLVSTMTLFEKCPKQIDYLLEMTRLAEEKGTVFDKGDKRLGRAKTLIDDGSLPPDKSKGGGTGGPSIDEAGEKGVEAGRGNSELRDFALGGDTGSLDSLSTDMGPDTGIGDAGGAGEAPAAK